MRNHTVVLAVLCTTTGLGGCSSAPLAAPDPQAERQGIVTAALAQVPSDVACVRITVAGGSRSTVGSFDVAAGETSASLTVSGAPLGDVAVSAQAFASGCSAVAPGAVATWVSDGVSAVLKAGVDTPVVLVMHHNGAVSACVDFPADDASAVDPSCATFKEFQLAAGSGPLAPIAGPDGAVWFVEPPANKIGRLTTDFSSLKEFDAPANSFPIAIAVGPDGNIWFAEGNGGRGAGHALARLDIASGAITEFPLPTNFLHGAGAVAAGPDGNLWYGANNEDTGTTSVLGQMSPNGVVLRELPFPTASVGNIVVGPDGNLWMTSGGGGFAGFGPGGVVRFVLASQRFDLFPSLHPNDDNSGLAVGPDGNFWFTIGPSDGFPGTDTFISRMTPAGVADEFVIPGSGGPVTTIAAPTSIALGPDGNLWFGANSVNGTNSRIGRITPAGDIAFFATPDPKAGPSVGTGPDGNIWFAEFYADRIAVLVP